jgi:very-short-patch-repair endonuclease
LFRYSHPRQDAWVSRESVENTYAPGAAAADLAGRQWGIVDDDELRVCGFSLAAVRRRRRNGWLHQVYPHVYAMGHAGLTMRARFLAAVKACGPGAALSHFAAAVLWSLLEWEEHRLPEVTIPMRGARNIPGIVIHRSRVPFKVIRFDAIPVVTPARALIDVSSVLPFDPLRRAVREAMALKRVTANELVGGSAILDRIIAEGYVPTRNEFEDAVHDLIAKGGFVKPDVNKIIVVGGKRTKPDFRWPEQRLTIEADGNQWHDSPLAREDDADRQARLEANGERVIRVSWKQATFNPKQTIARIRAAGAPSLPR